MAKIKKISINAMDRVMSEFHSPTTKFDWHGIEVTVKPTLSFENMMTFVDSVVKSCFTSDTGVYIPEVKDFALKSCILELYANFSMPSNIEHRYNLIYCTDAVEAVKEHINTEQLYEIECAIDEKIEHTAQANIDALNKQMNELYASLNNMQEQFANIFSGVGNDELSRLIGAISDGGLNEEKIVKAYIDNQKNGEE